MPPGRLSSEAAAWVIGLLKSFVSASPTES
jgi:hypothetical protein